MQRLSVKTLRPLKGSVPTLVVVGDSDVVGANLLKQAAVLANRIPKAESKILKGQSHGFFWAGS
jgi:pimeloyl-ACP methyl ester carboxylesterase